MTKVQVGQPVVQAAPAPHPPPCLGALRRLLDQLEREGIGYCHWKSNEHLEAALTGATDLDVLVDRSRSCDLLRILNATGFKRFEPTRPNAYPAMEDYLGFDEATGSLIHLHLHYELTLGEQRLKGYRVPWENRILATRVLRAGAGVSVCEPNMEMLLLIVRAALKLRSRDLVRACLGAGATSADLQREFEWLSDRTTPDEVCAIAGEQLGPAVVPALREILDRGPSFGRTWKLRRAAWHTLSEYRTHRPIAGRVARWLRELEYACSGIAVRYLKRPVPFKRTLPRGGLMIAFAGSDGSGKSTVTALIANWLAWKTEPYRVYFGSGQGTSSLMRLPLLVVHRASTKVRGGGRDSSQRGWLRSRLRLIWGLVLAREKRSKLRRAWRARNRGMIVICDRFPQNECMGFNDGPLCSEWLTHRSRILRALARWERGPYAWAEQNPPDLVIKLDVSESVALGRKPDMTAEEIHKRVEAVRRLRFGQGVKTVHVDADEPLERVLLQVKRLIWAEV